jgi:membrane-associated phospholipid phosphatase
MQPVSSTRDHPQAHPQAHPQPQRQALQRGLKQTVAAAVICAVLLYLSIAYVDRPVARYVYAHRAFAHLFELMATPSLLSLPLASIYLLIFAYRTVTGRQRTALTSLYLTLSIAIVAANAAKDELKLVIGRPWPFEWLHYGIYHLAPFTDNGAFGAFPSGHTAYIAAPMFVLWWRLPRYRPLWMGLVAMVMIGLVGYGFHFVGDVIGGFFLGLAAAAASVAAIPPAPLRPHRP